MGKLPVAPVLVRRSKRTRRSTQTVCNCRVVPYYSISDTEDDDGVEFCWRGGRSRVYVVLHTSPYFEGVFAHRL